MTKKNSNRNGLFDAQSIEEIEYVGKTLAKMSKCHERMAQTSLSGAEYNSEVCTLLDTAEKLILVLENTTPKRR